MDFLSSLFSGAKNLLGGLFGGGQSASRQAFGNTAAMAPQLSKGQLMSSPYQPGGTLPKSSGFNMGGLGGLLDNLFPGGKAQGIGGLAAPFLGNMFAPKVSLPDINQSQNVKALQAFRPGQSVSPEYQEMLQRNTGRLRDERLKQLQRVYKTARPGTDYTTDTNYQRDLAEIERGVQEQLGDSLASAEGQFSQQEQSRLENLAQMDVYSIMAQTGLDAQEANDFKQMFSNVGNMLLTNATKKPGQFDFSSLFSR